MERIADPNHFSVESDQAFHFNADSDPLDVNPDPTTHQVVTVHFFVFFLIFYLK